MTTQGKKPLRKLIEAVEAGSDEFSSYLPSGYEKLWAKFYLAFCGSLDAAKALHEALLPGWRLSDMGESDCTASGWFARVTMRGTIDQSISAFDQPRASRAWLLAILRAFEAHK